MYRSPRKPSETTSGLFLKVVGVFAMIALHCIGGHFVSGASLHREFYHIREDLILQAVVVLVL